MFNIAPDIPQVILDEFNIVDYSKINSVQKFAIMNFLKLFIRTHLQLKNAKKSYKNSGAKKKVCKDMDQDLLNLLNSVDWEITPKEKINEIVIMLKPYVLQLAKDK